MDAHGVLLDAGRAALHDTTGKYDGILSEKRRIRKRRRGGEREQAAYVGMARQPVVSEAEADGPEQVGPQDHEKEREQAFPALQVFADVSGIDAASAGSSGERCGFSALGNSSRLAMLPASATVGAALSEAAHRQMM